MNEGFLTSFSFQIEGYIFSRHSLNILHFGLFTGIFTQNRERNCCIYSFEWLTMCNPSAPGVFQHAKSIYAFKNAI
jgi:hypothetical protein